MAAVTAKNTSFDEGLTTVVLKQFLVYSFKKTFRYVAGVESRSFYGCKLSKCSSCTRYKNLLGFFIFSLNDEDWAKIFKAIRKLCKETKLKEFQFKFIHRIVVTKRELFNYGIKTDDECSIDHTFIHCSFTVV